MNLPIQYQTNVIVQRFNALNCGEMFSGRRKIPDVEDFGSFFRLQVTKRKNVKSDRFRVTLVFNVSDFHFYLKVTKKMWSI